MKRLLLALIVALFFIPVNLVADEGMWLPLLLKNEKYAKMRKMGLRLSPEEIYSINQACIKDAVIGLMGEGANLRSFGTASFISDSGLIITNYHVVLSHIERFSTKENDFIKYGYWANNRSEESLCRGLQMKQLIKMVDVTDRILEGTENLTGREKNNKINENGVAIAKELTAGTRYEAKTQALFGGSQYIMNIYAVYRDIRMVAAPPFVLGKFGGNDDNYSWPRHTADFAVLRVYANDKNEPASFNKNNRPYSPKHFLPISAKGVKENDFIMVVGYPGSTRQYVPSFALEKIIYSETAEKAAIAREKMNILQNAIEQDPSSKFRYTTRLSSVGNNYLRWSGEIMGVDKLDLVNVKREEERRFNEWVSKDEKRVAKYGDILERMEKLYEDVAEYNLANAYFLEAGITGSEIVPFIGKFEKLVAMYNRKSLNSRAADSEARRLIGLTHQFFNNWNYEVDRQMFRNLTYRYYQKMSAKFKPEIMDKLIHKYNGDIELMSQTLFANSIFTNKERLLEFLETESESRDVVNLMKNDELYQMAIGYYMINVDRIARQRGDLQSKLLELNAIYMQGLLEMNRKNTIYPDANNSQRVSYGRVTGVNSIDGLIYTPFTTLTGANIKYKNNLDNPDFYLPKKIRDLYNKKDFGRYGSKSGELFVNFLTNAHTTSGSSGSPVINSRGELVGLNFDRIWQGVGSDYRFDSDISRSISVDIRYILFILDKYAPNNYVLNQLQIKY